MSRDHTSASVPKDLPERDSCTVKVSWLAFLILQYYSFTIPFFTFIAFFSSSLLTNNCIRSKPNFVLYTKIFVQTIYFLYCSIFLEKKKTSLSLLLSLPVLFLSVSILCRFCLKLIVEHFALYTISLDINECDTNPCGENAICKDTMGSFICSCKEDYTGDPFKGCVDINECVTLEKPCGTHAICENAVPGYNCLCPQGYQAKPSPEIACEQVNEKIHTIFSST